MLPNRNTTLSLRKRLITTLTNDPQYRKKNGSPNYSLFARDIGMDYTALKGFLNRCYNLSQNNELLITTWLQDNT